jgi:hypothetical protein
MRLMTGTTLVATSNGIGRSSRYLSDTARRASVRDATEIEGAVAAFAQSANGGLILTASPLSGVHRDLIITLAASFLDQCRRAVGSL